MPGHSERPRSIKRVAIRATFPELRPAHANFFVGSASGTSSAAAISRAIREVFAKVREARKARRIRGRVSTIKMTVSISKT